MFLKMFVKEESDLTASLNLGEWSKGTREASLERRIAELESVDITMSLTPSLLAHDIARAIVRILGAVDDFVEEQMKDSLRMELCAKTIAEAAAIQLLFS